MDSEYRSQGAGGDDYGREGAFIADTGGRGLSGNLGLLLSVRVNRRGGE